MNDKKNNQCSKGYRPCVGIMLIDNNKNVFLGERFNRVGYWQMPQGGIEQDENIENAMKRELFEETGIKSDKIEILACFPEEIYYNVPQDKLPKSWGNKFCGQKVTFFLVKFLGNDQDINLNLHSQKEFRNFKWAEFDSSINEVVYFKRDMYKKVMSYFKDIIEINSDSLTKVI